MELTALVIAVVGLALAALSLGWQAATFFLSGPRVKVDLQEGFLGPMGLMTASASVYTAEGREALDRLGYTEHVLAVEAVNSGRLAVTVNNWSINFGNGASYGNPSDMRNPKLPHRLEPHTTALWCAPVEHLQLLQAEFTDQGARAATARGAITLPGRRAVLSKRALLIGPDEIQVVRPKRLARRLARKVVKPRG